MIVLPLSSPVCGRAWRFLAKWLSGNGFAMAVDATRCSGSVGTVTAGSAIAARRAVPKPGSSNGATPTAVTNGAQKDGWTTAIGNGSIGVATRRRA